jgi:hypothetical protein
MITRFFNKKNVAYLLLLLILGYGISLVFLKNINSDFFNEQDYLNNQTVESVIKDIQKGIYPATLKSSPDLFEYLVEEITTTDLELPIEEDRSQHLVLVSRLLLELTVASKRYKNLESIRSNQGRNKRLYELTEYLVKIVLKNDGLSKSADQIAANLLVTSVIDFPEHASMTDAKLMQVYSDSRKTPLRFNQLSAAIIIVLWLDRTSTSFDENINYIVELKKSVVTSGDLIRLMNHADDQVVLKTAQLIKKITPDNAIHALKYHLIHSKNESVQLAVLDAIAEYGIETRPYASQLRAFLHVSKSDQVKQKIIIVLKQINGL